MRVVVSLKSRGPGPGGWSEGHASSEEQVGLGSLVACSLWRWEGGETFWMSCMFVGEIGKAGEVASKGADEWEVSSSGLVGHNWKWGKLAFHL